MLADDWPAVRAIFVEGIETHSATFETEPPDYESFDAGHLAEHRLVGVEDGRVVGWVTLAPTSARACYAGVVESSVYEGYDEVRTKGLDVAAEGLEDDEDGWLRWSSTGELAY